MTLHVPSYQETAQYILDQIEKAGLNDPRMIVRLTRQLADLTEFAAKAVQVWDELSVRDRALKIIKDERIPVGDALLVDFKLDPEQTHPDVVKLTNIREYPPITAEELARIAPPSAPAPEPKYETCRCGKCSEKVSTLAYTYPYCQHCYLNIDGVCQK